MLDDLTVVFEAEEVHRHVLFVPRLNLMGMQDDQVTLSHGSDERDGLFLEGFGVMIHDRSPHLE